MAIVVGNLNRAHECLERANESIKTRAGVILTVFVTAIPIAAIQVNVHLFDKIPLISQLFYMIYAISFLLGFAGIFHLIDVLKTGSISTFISLKDINEGEYTLHDSDYRAKEIANLVKAYESAEKVNISISESFNLGLICLVTGIIFFSFIEIVLSFIKS
jgi:hypothetical protein